MTHALLPKILPRRYVSETTASPAVTIDIAKGKKPRKALARKTPMKQGTKQLPRQELQRAGESMPKRSGTMKRRSPKPSDAKNRSETWLAAVRSIPICQSCLKNPTSAAAHENQGKGIGWKVPDCLTAALCDPCHFAIDNGNELTLDVRRWMLANAQRRSLVYLFTRDMIGANAP